MVLPFTVPGLTAHLLQELNIFTVYLWRGHQESREKPMKLCCACRHIVNTSAGLDENLLWFLLWNSAVGQLF